MGVFVKLEPLSRRRQVSCEWGLGYTNESRLVTSTSCVWEETELMREATEREAIYLFKFRRAFSDSGPRVDLKRQFDGSGA
jgi:hypothetical protein